MAQKKSGSIVQRKQPKAEKSEEIKTESSFAVTGIIFSGEMPPQSEMKEGWFYVSYSGQPQVRLKVQGKILKFKLEG